MSRKKTDQAIEHRITLGDLERREMRDLLRVAKRRENINSTISGVKAAGLLSVAALGVGVGYLGVKAYAGVKDGIGDVLENIENTVKNGPVNAWNFMAGSETKPDPETGVEYIVPKTVVNQKGQNVANPLWTVPVVGGLFYAGMKIGEANPLPDWTTGMFEF